MDKTRFDFLGEKDSDSKSCHNPLWKHRLKLPMWCCSARPHTTFSVIITNMMVVVVVVAPFSFGLKCRSFLSLLGPTTFHRYHRRLTCRCVPQIPLHLRESHLGQVQRRSVALQKRTDLSEAGAERRAGASHHRRSSHLSKRRETGGEGPLQGCDLCEWNEWREWSTYRCQAGESPTARRFRVIFSK